jgi:uncharacterized protein YbaA (DUF1428 family)
MKKITVSILTLLLANAAHAASPLATEGFVRDGLSQLEAKIPDDSNMVHKTGVETIVGRKTFTELTEFDKMVNADQGLKTKHLYDEFSNVTLEFENGEITAVQKLNVLAPENDSQAANKKYVDDAIAAVPGGTKPDWNALAGDAAEILNKPAIPTDSALVHKNGDETISGNKTFDGSITIFDGNVDIASGQLDMNDNSITGVSSVGGSNGYWFAQGGDGTMTLVDDLNADGNLIHNVGAPVSNGDAANKKYVDDIVAAIPGGATPDWNAPAGDAAEILNKPAIPDDSNLVHKTDDETIHGTKTFHEGVTTGRIDGLTSTTYPGGYVWIGAGEFIEINGGTRGVSFNSTVDFRRDVTVQNGYVLTVPTPALP